MQQLMGSSSLAPHATGLCPRLRAAEGTSAISSRSRSHRIEMVTGQAGRLGRVTAAHAAPRPPICCLLRGAAAIAGPESSCLLRGAAAIAGPGSSCLLDDQHAPSFNESNLQLTPTIRKDKYFEVEMTVRDDEIDEYGVVNNAIYVSYIHTGRNVMLENLGISVDYWASTGKAMAVSELNLKYFTPLRSGDRFVVKMRPVQIKGVRMVIHHLIETLPDYKLVLDARGTIVFLDKGYRPTRVFPEVAAKAWEMFACKDQG